MYSLRYSGGKAISENISIRLKLPSFLELLCDQNSIGINLICEEIALLHQSTFTNTDSEILHYRPDVYNRDDTSVQTK
jgi:hypothetical protein